MRIAILPLLLVVVLAGCAHKEEAPAVLESREIAGVKNVHVFGDI